MAWTLKVSAINQGDPLLEVFGQLVFSGNYTTGGDNGGTFDASGDAGAGWTNFLNESAVHAGRPPVKGNLQFDAGYWAVLVPVAGQPLPKIKIYSGNGVELAAGAYPAAITGAAQHTMELDYKKNL